jgi:hypothetical protein
VTLREHQCAFTTCLGRLLVWCAEQGHIVAIKEVQRTPEQQQRYMSQGKSRTMHSKHLDCLAADLALFCDGVYQTRAEAYAPLGAYWKSLSPHCVWGGDWRKGFVDAVHFEWKR